MLEEGSVANSKWLRGRTDAVSDGESFVRFACQRLRRSRQRSHVIHSSDQLLTAPEMSTGLHLRRSREQWAEKITSAPPPEHRADAQQQQPQQQQHRSLSPVSSSSSSSSSAHHAAQPQLPQQHAYHHLVGVPVALDAVPLQRAPVPHARARMPGHVPPLMSENPYAFLLSSEPPPPPRATPNTLAAVNYLQTLLAEPSMRAGNARYVGPVDDDYQQQRQAPTLYAADASASSAAYASAAPPSLQSMLAPDEPASPSAAYYRAQAQAQAQAQPPNSNAPPAANKRAEFWSNAIKQAASSSSSSSSSSGSSSFGGYGSGGESAAPHRSPAPRRLDSREGREHADKLARQREYVEALHFQMQEKQARARQQREREIELERAKDEEIRTYNPFGRAGAGAPLRDESGRVITQLTELRNKALQNEPVSPTQWHSPPASLRSPRKTAGGSGGGGVTVSMTSYSASDGGSSNASAFAFTKAPPGGNYGSPTASSSSASNNTAWPSSASASSSLSLSPRRATTPLTARFGGSITRLHEHQSPQEVSQRERARLQLQEDLAAQVREKQERVQMEKVGHRSCDFTCLLAPLTRHFTSWFL